MGTVTKTIGTSARDYSTIAAWSAALPANLVTDGNSYVGQCYNDSEFGVTAQISLAGHTTDSTHNITLTTGTGQSFRDNANVRTNALDYNQANGVGIKANVFFGGTDGVINSDVSQYTTISNIQINSNNNGSGISDNANAAQNVTYSNLLVKFGSNYGGYGIMAAQGCLIKNCVVINNSAVVNIGIRMIAGTIAFCTIVTPSNLSPAAATGILTNFNGAGGGTTVENCAVFGFPTLLTNAYGGTTTSTTNQCSNASPPAGWTQKTYNNSYFVDTAADWRLASGSPAQGAGTSDSTNGATDISGLARPQGGSWDISAWELAAALPSGPPPGTQPYIESWT